VHIRKFFEIDLFLDLALLLLGLALLLLGLPRLLSARGLMEIEKNEI
jgi:hypothetical protein